MTDWNSLFLGNIKQNPSTQSLLQTGEEFATEGGR